MVFNAAAVISVLVIVLVVVLLLLIGYIILRYEQNGGLLPFNITEDFSVLYMYINVFYVAPKIAVYFETHASEEGVSINLCIEFTCSNTHLK
jgi:hypothetical protein